MDTKNSEHQHTETNQRQLFTYTEQEAAGLLKVSRITLQRLRIRGEIAFSRIGGSRVIYTHQNLLDYIDARKRAAFHSC